MKDKDKTKEQLINELIELRKRINQLEDSDSKRKETEETLCVSKAQLSATVESLPFDFFVIDSTGRYVMQNDVCKEHWGDVVGKRPEDLDVDKDTLAVWQDNNRRAFSGKTIKGEVQLKFPAGEKRYYYNIISPVRNEDQIIGILGVNIDITERKSMESELQEAYKIESLGNLAAGIAHNFNNILTVIDGNITLAKMYAKPGLEIYDILVEAEKASLRAKNMVQQLLTFSKGGIAVKERMSVSKLIKASADFALDSLNIKCEISIQDDLWQIVADAGQIQQVINNIILNAHQSMPKGGVIRVKSYNITSEAEDFLPLKEGKYIKIIIEDQGDGISAEDLPKIFDPYFSTKQEWGGFGLAIANSIIKKHDGYIAVESKPGVGTIFTVYLPVDDEKDSTIKDSDELSINSRAKGRILVLDDEEMVRDVINRMMDQFGYEADFAKEGAEAIALYKESKVSRRPYLAVIIDLIIIGGMGGKETIEKLLEIDPDVKAIVSSGYSHDPVIANYKDYGFKAYLSKPYKMENMYKVLDQVIKGSG